MGSIRDPDGTWQLPHTQCTLTTRMPLLYPHFGKAEFKSWGLKTNILMEVNVYSIHIHIYMYIYVLIYISTNIQVI